MPVGHEGGRTSRVRGARQYKDKWPRSPRSAERGRQVARRTLARGEVIPKHVTHCYANGSREWWLWRWKKGAPETVTRAPYYCNSWRCQHCRRHESAVTFARIKQAFAPLDPKGVVFAVLTLDRDGYYSGKPWPSAAHAFRELSTMSRKFLKRLNRLCVARGWRPVGNRWVSTVEAHRSGWPHVNLVLYCPELAIELERERLQHVSNGKSQREATLLDGDILGHALACGYGPQSTAERARDVDALAGYVTKLAGEAGALASEVAKLTQLPTNAPVRFRRLRAGKGFLPPRHRNPNVTGTLVRRRRERDGTITVLPLHEVPPEAVEQVARCCYREEWIAIDELAHWRERQRLASLGLAHLAHVPPVSVWLVGTQNETGPPDARATLELLTTLARARAGAVA